MAYTDMPNFPITAEEYREFSKAGICCAIVFCENSPTHRCEISPSCGIHYCPEHYLFHFHVGE